MKQCITNFFLIAGFILCSSLLSAQPNNVDRYQISSYKNATKAPAENFTGTVWVSMITGGDENYHMSSGSVTFEPKARTNWHSHGNGQVLIISKGVGYYQEEGKPIQLIQNGDVVKIPKDVKHWHGASHNSAMSHIAIVTETDEYTATIWMEPVSDEDYNSVLKK